MLSCIKYMVIIYNFVFWLLGVAILGVTVFLYVDSQNYVNFEDTSELYMTPFLLLMALGAIMTLVGFLGCCGAVRESTCILGTYFLICITMCVACGAAVWWSVQNADVVKERIHKDISKVMKEKYGRGMTGVSDLIIDTIQKDFQCCGVKSPNDWASSVYNQPPNSTKTVLDYGIGNNLRSSTPSGLYKVPQSCCKRVSFQCEKQRETVPVGTNMSNISALGINTDGCLEKINIYIEEQWKWLIIVAGVLIGVQFFALIFACCLCCAISRDEDK